MPSNRYFAFEMSMPGTNASVAQQAINLLIAYEQDQGQLPLPAMRDAPFEEIFPQAPDHTDPSAASFAITLFQALCDNPEAKDKQGKLLSLDRLECVVNSYTDGLHFGAYEQCWVDWPPLLTIVTLCQDHLGGGHAAIRYDDDVYGERYQGAIFKPPGEDAEWLTLEDWLEDKIKEYKAAAGEARADAPQPGV